MACGACFIVYVHMSDEALSIVSPLEMNHSVSIGFRRLLKIRLNAANVQFISSTKLVFAVC